MSKRRDLSKPKLVIKYLEGCDLGHELMSADIADLLGVLVTDVHSLMDYSVRMGRLVRVKRHPYLYYSLPKGWHPTEMVNQSPWAADEVDAWPRCVVRRDARKVPPPDTTGVRSVFDLGSRL
jgi:hypothetical protein